MEFTRLPLTEACLVTPTQHKDSRGFFERGFCSRELEAQGLDTRIAQINTSFSHTAGTLRGLHFQRPPHAEAKLIRCIRGAVWDVIVDLREGSPTYSEWFGARLDTDNRLMMYVPKGFAHGFITLAADSEVLYGVSEFYSPEYEGILRWDDEFHGIEWPQTPTVLSERDRTAADWNDEQHAIRMPAE